MPVNYDARLVETKLWRQLRRGFLGLLSLLDNAELVRLLAFGLLLVRNAGLAAQALFAKLHVGFIGSAVPIHRLEQSHRIPANPVFIVVLGKRIYSVQDTRCKAHRILRQTISNVTQAIPLIKAAE